MRQLLERAALVTVAREPDHCGSAEKCEQIWEDVQRLVLREPA